MKLVPLAAAAACLALAGCASVLKDLEKCERHYNGTVSGGTMTPAVLAGQGKVDCCPVSGMVPDATHSNCVWPAAKPLPLTAVVVPNAPPPTT